MANPNLLQPTAIYGKTAVQAVGTSATAIVDNASGSNKIFKINALYVSNIGAVNESVTIDIYRSSTAYNLANTVIVPANSTIDVITKNIYLEEGDSLRLTAVVTSAIEAICSYEEIS